MILKPQFRDYLLQLAESNDIAHQYYISPGGTDGGEIHKANEGFQQQSLAFVRDISTVLMQYLI